MKKRIRRKVTKRIINKVGTEQSLTYFERKYFIKFFWKPLSKELFRIGEQLKAEAELQTQSILKHMYELEDAEETAVEQAEWLSGIDLTEQKDFTVYGRSASLLVVDEETKFYEPSKWQKAKAKMKGWFGK